MIIAGLYDTDPYKLSWMRPARDPVAAVEVAYQARCDDCGADRSDS